MNKRNEQVAALATLLALGWTALDGALLAATQLRVLAALLTLGGAAAYVSLLVYMRLRLARRAAEEERAAAAAARARESAPLFEPGEAIETLPIAQTRRQFETYLLPALSMVLAGGLAGCVMWLVRQLALPPAVPQRELLALATLAGQAFALFLFSRYLLGLANEPAGRLLRGPGVALGVGCWATLLGIGAVLAVHLGLAAADTWAAWVVTAWLGLSALEIVAQFIAELYRPRRRGELGTRAYESRLGGLLTEPGRWARNLAGALDYQFGFQVSQTWLYRFLATALGPLLLFQLLVLYLLSCVVFLGPDEQGLRERLGRPIAQWDSGMHLKWPWPIETVRRLPAKRVLRVRIGQSGAASEPSVIQWHVPHAATEDQFLVAAPHAGAGAVPVNLVAFNVPVEYQITNLYAFAYHHADADRLVALLAYRSLTQEAATRDLFELLSAARNQVAAALHARLQAEADRHRLGIRILFVGLQGVHPPTPVAAAFQAVVGALEEREAAILTARGAATRTVTLAAADSVKTQAEAAGYRHQRMEISAAEADRFRSQWLAAEQSPRVFRSDRYLQTLATALADTRKVIVPAGLEREVLQLNLEEKLRPELFDLGPRPTAR